MKNPLLDARRWLRQAAYDLEQAEKSLGTKLDRHRLASRYPDALLEPAVPYESYSREDSEEALAIAREIVATVKRFFAA